MCIKDCKLVITGCRFPPLKVVGERRSRPGVRVRGITLLTVVLFSLSAFAGNQTGIFVDGGYSPGSKDTEMDKMLDKRLDDAMKTMKKKNADADTSKINHRADLERKLRNLHCKCGDEIILYMVGHGSESIFGAHAFEFVKDGNEISPSDLRSWLRAAADECCCKIHVVIFSCHSGAFRDELLRDSHVVSVYTSCTDKELSYSDSYLEDTTFHDGGDWIKGFNEDWDSSKADNIGDILQDASESADDKMPDKFGPNEHPTGWRKGEVNVLAHVVERKREGKPLRITKLKLHFLKPEFLRCTTREVDVSKGEVSDSVNTCKWVSLILRLGGPADRMVLDSGQTVTIVEQPTENILAHVEGVSKDRKRVFIHVISPKWLYCSKLKLDVEKDGWVDGNLTSCNWVRIKVKIKDPEKTEGGFSTSDSVKAVNQTFNVRVHVEKVGKEKGIIEYHILDPPWLKCDNRKIEGLPPDKLKGIDKCTNLIFDLTFRRDGTDSVSNIKIITESGRIKKFSRDVAVQRPPVPVLTDSNNVFSPSVGVTNVGTSTVSFPIYAAICKLSDFYLIQNWWRTGEGEPSGVWYSLKNVTELPFAQTRSVNFDTWNVSPVSETYWMGFMTKLEGDENPSSDTASVVFTVTRAVNHPPVLADGHVQPDSGNVSTTFTFEVTYIDIDNDPPALRKVFIDSSSFDMVATGNNYSEGVLFGYQTTLSQGPHTFYFKFDDGQGHLVMTQTYPGPFVIGQMNQPPTLQQGSVMPDSGTVTTPFIFRVLYTDPDNDPPSVHQVLIDNNPINMNPTGSNFSEGVWFICQMMNLYPGNHNFIFRFDDGHGHLVNSQTYQGPIVH